MNIRYDLLNWGISSTFWAMNQDHSGGGDNVGRDKNQQDLIQYIGEIVYRLLAHKQTVFLIEKLQPRDLSNRWQRLIYGLIYGLIVGLKGVELEVKRKPNQGIKASVNNILTWIMVSILVPLLLTGFLIIPNLPYSIR